MPKVVTVQTRVDEFRNDGFYVFNREKKVCMCKFCNCVVDWGRLDSCKKHVATALHKSKKAEAQKAGEVKSQKTLESTLHGNSMKKARTEREEMAKDLTEAFLAANIPMEKLENDTLRGFLNKYIPGKYKLIQLYSSIQ